MAATKTKTLSIPQLLEEFRKLFPDTPELQRMPQLLECVIFSILRENHSIEAAMAAFEKLANRDNFIDWNDLRVSDLHEIRGYLAGYADPDHRGSLIKRFLRELFRKNYKFEVEGLSRKTWKEAREELSAYDTLSNDFHLSQVQVLLFGGHAFPVDQRIALMIKRLGLADAAGDAVSIRALIEKNISKAQILLAIRLFDRFVETICKVDSPACTACPLSASCPDYQARLAPPKPAKAVETKSKSDNKKAAPPANTSGDKPAKAAKPASPSASDKAKDAEKKQPVAAKTAPAKSTTPPADKKPSTVAAAKKPEAAKTASPPAKNVKAVEKPATPAKPGTQKPAAKSPAPAKATAPVTKTATAPAKPVAKKPEAAKPTSPQAKNTKAAAKPSSAKNTSAKPEKKPAKKK